MKKCSICNQLKEYNFFSKNQRRKDGYDTRCKSCMSVKRIQWQPENIFKKYQRDAIKRNLKFDLSELEFNSFKNQSCYYCGQKLDRVRLDRVNNEIGYVIHNVVSCCANCNNFKSSLTQEDFLKHITKIYCYQKDNGK